MSDAASAPPYRTGMATGVGVVLGAGLVLAVADIVHTGGAAVALLALWATIALPAAVATGVVLGAGNAQWGVGWVRRAFARLVEDPELDRSVTSGLLTGLAIGGVLAVVIAKFSLGFVGNVNRKEIGALILGAVVVVLIPVIALGALPLYRGIRFANKMPLTWFAAPAAVAVIAATLRLNKWFGAATLVVMVVLRVQPIGKFSRLVILLVVPPAALAIAAPRIIVHKVDLDWEALNLWSLIVPALLPVIAIAIAVLAYYPLAHTRQRIRRRGAIVAAGGAFAALVLVLGLRGPSDATRDAVTGHSYIGVRLVPVLRKLIDRDHDGYSAFFGGPDCDDHNPDVYPTALEIPGNGIDENCIGGDGKVDAAASDPPPGDAGAPPVPTLSGGNNVLVIFVDTLRYDRLGIAGYQRDGKSLTPRLDAFANESVVFSSAYAQAPNTPRSVPSFLASRYPSQLKVDRRTRDYPTVQDDNDLLFEALAPAGFKTIGMTSHFFFCDRVRDPKMCPDVVPWMKSNVLQGASEWDNDGALNIPESNKDIAGPRIVKKTVARLEALAGANEKFAMLVHLFEPHSTYMTHEGYPITTHGDESLAQKYDYEVAVVDRFIGEILDTVERTGLAKTTTVVVMSDHGEAFGVHRFAGGRMFFHGQTLYRELLHVPLIFRVPGAKPRITDDVVELIDLAPTIAALFGVTPPASWRGRSLVPAIAGEPLTPKPAYAELLPADAWNHDAKSMVTADGKRHVFYRISDSAWEIFDLVADPEERKNLADSDPNATQLQQELAHWIEGPLATGASR